jgi:hypothetical protein
MAILKNTANQKVAVFAYTAATGAAKTGDAANITAYLSKDWGAAAAVTDTNPTEMDATNMPGWYAFDLSQAETNAEVLVLAPKSATAGVVVDQVQVFTQAAAVPAAADIRSAVGLAAANLDTQLGDVPTVAEFNARTLPSADYFDAATDTVANVTAVGSVTGAVGSVTGAVGSVTGNVGGNVAGSVGSVTGAVGSVTGNVGGSVTGSVGSVAVGGITAASIATDAIDADALAANAVAEIQAGLSTLDAAGIRTAVGLAAANLDTQLGDVPTNAELAVALAAADDAVLAAIAALNNLSQAQAQTAAAAALTAYDAATGADVTNATTGLATTEALGDVPTNAELTAALGGLNDIAVADILAAAYEGAETIQSYLRLTRAALVGESTGGGTGTRTFRDAADTKARITATVDGSSNRTLVTTDAT